MNGYFTKDWRQFTIRKPTAADAEEIISYSKIVFASTDQMLTTLEEYTITEENEKNWIENLNNGLNSLILIAEMDRNIIGLLFFIPNTKIKNCHAGEFGINVHPKYQGIGIGQVLLENLIKWAREHKQIEKIFLQVFATNYNAIKLYKKLGFIEEGRLINAIKQLDEKYVDVLQMYMETR